MNTVNELKLLKLSPEEKAERHILGRLAGPCADTIKDTRNGRHYSDELWRNVFSNPTVLELFEAGGIFGCFGHPKEDIPETELNEKIAICMPEIPQKDSSGKLVGYWDILDTPCGQVAYTVAKYGFKLGISSRGNGDLVEDYNGRENVDPDTFDFQAFDLVILPAVKEARLSLVESLDKNKEFKQELRESIENADDVSKKIMLETLENLGIDYKKSSEIEEDNNVKITPEEVADNDGTDLVSSLQEALRENNELHTQVFALNEKLSVSSTKEMKLEAKIQQLTNTVRKLGESTSKSKAMNTQLLSMKEQLEKTLQQLKRERLLTESYKHKVSKIKSDNNTLNESYNESVRIISDLKQQITSLKQDLSETQHNDSKLIESLKVELSKLKTDSKVKNTQYSGKLNESKETIEKYKKLAAKAVDKYIECKATNFGITSSEIKNRLSESYTFDEIDRVCEDLRRYKLNISKLPFNVGKANIKTMSMQESVESRAVTNPDDVLDSAMLDLLNL